MALVASIVLPGLGHVSAGRYRRGAVCFAIGVLANVLSVLSLFAVVRFRLLWSELVLLGLLTAPVLYIWVDAFLCGWRAKRPAVRPAWLRVAAGTALLLASVFFNPWQAAVLTTLPFVRSHVGLYVARSAGMAPTVQNGDRVLVDRHAKLERWCIVAHVGPPGSPYLKRVVGLPGETIEIKGGEIHVNGVLVPRPAGLAAYVQVRYFGQQDPNLRGHPGAGCGGNPIHLADGEYYVLGDNSAQSLDARLWETPIDEHQLGALPADAIVGHVTHIYWPPSRWRVFD